MTDQSAATWRRRCLAAEERLDVEARTAKRWRAKAGKLSAQLADATNDRDAAQDYALSAARVIRRLADTHLGPGASRSETLDLIERWFHEDDKTQRPHQTVSIGFAIDATELLRRLGIEPDAHDESGDD